MFQQTRRKNMFGGVSDDEDTEEEIVTEKIENDVTKSSSFTDIFSSSSAPTALSSDTVFWITRGETELLQTLHVNPECFLADDWVSRQHAAKLSATFKHLQRFLRDTAESNYFCIGDAQPVVKSVKEYFRDFPGFTAKPARHYEGSEFVAVGESSETSDLFDSVSLHMGVRREYSNCFCLLTFLEMCNNNNFIQYCENNRYNPESLKLGVLRRSDFTNPPVIAAVANIIQRNIVLHFDDLNTTQSPIQFGNNPLLKTVHLMIDEENCRPLVKLTETTATSATDWSVIRNNPFVSNYEPCVACNVLRKLQCAHRIMEQQNVPDATTSSADNPINSNTHTVEVTSAKIKQTGKFKAGDLNIFKRIIKEEVEYMITFDNNCENIDIFLIRISHYYNFWLGRIQSQTSDSKSQNTKRAKRLCKFVEYDDGQKTILQILQECRVSESDRERFRIQSDSNLMEKEDGPNESRRGNRHNLSFVLNKLKNIVRPRKPNRPFFDYKFASQQNSAASNAGGSHFGPAKENISTSLASQTSEGIQEECLAAHVTPNPNQDTPSVSSRSNLGSSITLSSDDSCEPDSNKASNYDDANAADVNNSEVTDRLRIEVQNARKHIQDLATALGATQADLNYRPPRKFSFILSASTMNKIFHYENNEFRANSWKAAVDQGLVSVQKSCSFNSVKSVKYYKATPHKFCLMQGRCGGRCAMKFDIVVRTTPLPGRDVEFFVDSCGHFELIQIYPTGREIRGAKRDEYKTILSEHNSGKIYLQNMSKLSLLRLLHNNMDQKSLRVLQIIRHESLHSIEASKNCFEDINIFREQCRNSDATSRQIKGFIHNNVLSEDYINFHFYTETAFRVFHVYRQRGLTVAHCDASGGFTTTRAPKNPLLYLTVIRTGSGTTFPLGGMISTRGREVEIGNFLHWLNNTSRQISSSKRRFADITCTDFSFAFMNSVLRGFNCMSLKDYLNYCYRVLNKSQPVDPEKTTLINCCNHLMGSFSNLLKTHFGSSTHHRNVKRAGMHSLANLQQCVTLEDFRNTSNIICTLFCDISLTPERANNIVEFLTGRAPIEEEYECLEHEDTFSESDTTKSIKTSSPFYQMFSNIRKGVEQEVDAAGVIQNPYYNPKILGLLHNYYVPFCPLFASMMPVAVGILKPGERVSNGAIENEFKQTKSVYHEHKREALNIWIRNHRDYYLACLNRIISFEANDSKKRMAALLKTSSVPQDQEEEETWGVKRKPKRQSKYFTKKTKFSQTEDEEQEGPSATTAHSHFTNPRSTLQERVSTPSVLDNDVENVATNVNSQGDLSVDETSVTSEFDTQSHYSLLTDTPCSPIPEELTSACSFENIRAQVGAEKQNKEQRKEFDHPSNDKRSCETYLTGPGIRKDIAKRKAELDFKLRYCDRVNKLLHPPRLIREVNEMVSAFQKDIEENEKRGTDVTKNIQTDSCETLIREVDNILKSAAPPRRNVAQMEKPISDAKISKIPPSVNPRKKKNGRNNATQYDCGGYGTVVSRIFNDGNDNVSACNLKSGSILELLHNTSWIANDVMNAYMLKLKVDTTSNSSYYISSADFVYKLGAWKNKRSGEDFVFDDSTDTIISGKPYILHPLRLDGHWVLLCLNFLSKVCRIYDSKFPPNIPARVDDIKNNALRAFLDTSDNLDKWTMNYETRTLQQKDGNSCGIHVMKTATLLYKSSGSLYEAWKCQVNDPTADRYKVAIFLLETTEEGRKMLEAAKGNREALVNILKADFESSLKKANSAALE